MVLTVCDPWLLLNGRCNNRSHSIPAGPCSRSQLLYLSGQTRGVSACVFVRACSASACSVHVCLCVAWLCAMTTLSLEEHVRASRGWTRPWWHRYGSMLGSPFICCHARWPPSTAHIENRKGKKGKLQGKQPSGAREEETAIHNSRVLFHYCMLSFIKLHEVKFLLS